jgi:hypothetical protein
MAGSLLPLTLWLWALASFQCSDAKMNPGSYAPKTNQQCPATLLRQPPAANQTLSPSETQYLADRRKQFPDAWRDWVGDGSNLGYDLNKLGITANNGSGLPIIGIAASGGGYRCVSHACAPKIVTLRMSCAAHHKTVLVSFLVLMHATRLPRQRARVASCKWPVTCPASVAGAGSSHRCSSTTSRTCTILFWATPTMAVISMVGSLKSPCSCRTVSISLTKKMSISGGAFSHVSFFISGIFISPQESALEH